MAYIRMKDGKVRRVNGPFTATEAPVKTADNLEDLCDYEMHYDNNGEFVIRKIKHVDFESLKRVIRTGWFRDCKLAILTDKGLIYVAKMNDKGELELL